MSLYLYAFASPALFSDAYGLTTYVRGTSFPTAPPPDEGFGQHGALGPPTVRDYAWHYMWWEISHDLWMRILYPDATRHMRHYLENRGTPITDVRVDHLVNHSDDAKAFFYSQINDAMAAAEAENDCGHFILIGAWEGTNAYDNRNWHAAVGQYRVCGKATVVNLGDCRYRMIFTYRLIDRYNYNRGDVAHLLGIPIRDDDMGRLHEVGIAKEYDLSGEMDKVTVWRKGQRYDTSTGELIGQDDDR